MSKTPPEDTLRAFIADENEAVKTGEQGGFYPMHHYQIGPAMKRAAGLLTPEERLALYAHYMRVTWSIPVIDKADFELLKAAYPMNTQRHSRIYFAFCFGYDERGALPSGVVDTYAELQSRLQVMKQCGAYSTLPNQRDKVDKFAPFAPDYAGILLEALRHTGYESDTGYDTAVSLPVWSAVIIVLLNPDYAMDCFNDIRGNPNLPEKETFDRILGQTADAVHDFAPNPLLAHATEPLHAELAAKAEGSESLALVRALKLPFAEDDEWLARIYLPHADTPMYGNHKVILELWSNPDYAWKVTVFTPSATTTITEANGKFSDQIGLPEMGALANFPEWLRAVSAQEDLELSPDTAVFSLGRKRSAIKLLKAWIFD